MFKQLYFKSRGNVFGQWERVHQLATIGENGREKVMFKV